MQMLSVEKYILMMRASFVGILFFLTASSILTKKTECPKFIKKKKKKVSWNIAENYWMSWPFRLSGSWWCHYFIFSHNNITTKVIFRSSKKKVWTQTKFSCLRSLVFQFLKTGFWSLQQLFFLVTSSLVLISYLHVTIQCRYKNTNKEMNFFLFCVNLKKLCYFLKRTIPTLSIS